MKFKAKTWIIWFADARLVRMICEFREKDCMRLEQLQYFVQIVENRSFNKAAQKLFVTQPALTSSMNQLEEELGVRLLVRTKRGVSPTAYGSRIYEDCKDIIDDLNRKISVWKSFAHGFRPSPRFLKNIRKVRMQRMPACCRCIPSTGRDTMIGH